LMLRGYSQVLWWRSSRCSWVYRGRSVGQKRF